MENLINFVGTHIPQIAGALILAAVVAYLAGLNNKRNRLAVASSNFRNVFLTELKGLYPIPSDWPSDINALDARLKIAFPKLQAAIAEFRPFIHWYYRRAFDKAWFIYRLGKDGREIDKQCYHQYTAFESNPYYKENFKHNVDKLLSYAKTI